MFTPPLYHFFLLPFPVHPLADPGENPPVRVALTQTPRAVAHSCALSLSSALMLNEGEFSLREMN